MIATSIIAGIFAVSNAFSAFIFGSIVDHNRKKNVMLRSSSASLVLYLIGSAIYRSFPESAFMEV